MRGANKGHIVIQPPIGSQQSCASFGTTAQKRCGLALSPSTATGAVHRPKLLLARNLPVCAHNDVGTSIQIQERQLWVTGFDQLGCAGSGRRAGACRVQATFLAPAHTALARRHPGACFKCITCVTSAVLPARGSPPWTRIRVPWQLPHVACNCAHLTLLGCLRGRHGSPVSTFPISKAQRGSRARISFGVVTDGQSNRELPRETVTHPCRVMTTILVDIDSKQDTRCPTI